MWLFIAPIVADPRLYPAILNVWRQPGHSEVLIEVECRVSDRALGENPQGEQRNVLPDRVSHEAVSAREKVPVPAPFGER